MDHLDTREWLLTNGLGGFASGTVCDARSRSYHGWLIAALDPPNQRTLLLSHLEASLEIDGQVFALGTNFWTEEKVDPLGYRQLRSFTQEPVPTWVWSQSDQWQLTRRIAMPYGLPRKGSSLPTEPQPSPVNRILIHYAYSGSQLAVLRLRPLITDRNFHHPQKQKPELAFSQLLGTNQVFLQTLQGSTAGTPWQLRWTQGHYQPEGTWYWNYYYPEDAARGLEYREDLYSPGYLTVLLQPGDSLTLEARVGLPSHTLPELTTSSFDQTVQAGQQRIEREFVHLADVPGEGDSLRQRLLRASDQFIVYRNPSAPSILAGYHWYGDRCRDTLLCLPGFTLTTQRFSLARKILDRLGRLCFQGLIPNDLGSFDQKPEFRSIDCSLWWIETLGLYLEATQDWDFLTEQYGVVKQIYKSFTAGTLHNIRIDASDGLVTWDDGSVALSWMDAYLDGKPVTPRHGKPIEINALWYSALCWANQWAIRLGENPAVTNSERLANQARRYEQQARQVKDSLQKFWNSKQNYLFDRIEPDDRLDPQIRPNAVIALSLHHSAFSQEQIEAVLTTAGDRLLTPYGLRTLDPQDPGYQGQCTGNTRKRELAVHQGTVWSWLLGRFIAAWRRSYGTQRPLPVEPYPLLAHFTAAGCLGAVAEMFDGDAPHTPRGAVASASPIAELLRYWQEIEPE